MDCLTARTTLDLVPPSAEGGADTVQAAEHVAGCPECQAVVRSHREFDRRVGQVCRAVPVPPGLRESLLSQLAGETVPVLEPVLASPAKARSRRHLMKWFAGLTAALVIGGGLWFTQSPPRPVPFEAVALELTQPDLDGAGWAPLTSFGYFGAPSVRPPRAVSFPMIEQSAPKELVVDNRVVGIWVFQVTDSRRRKMNARLIVAPRTIVEPPASSANSTGAWPVSGWYEGQLVYFLAVEGSERELRRHLPRNPI